MTVFEYYATDISVENWYYLQMLLGEQIEERCELSLQV